MMRLKNLFGFIGAGLILLVPMTASAGMVSSAELLAQAEAFDAKTVIYTGEVIGPVLKRGAFAWLNVHDTDAALGVWAPARIFQDVAFCGGYKVKGDLVRVTGIFHRHCSEHGGGTDIHAQEITVLRRGGSREELVDPRKNIALQALLGVSLCLWIVHKWRKRRPGK